MQWRVAMPVTVAMGALVLFTVAVALQEVGLSASVAYAVIVAGTILLAASLIVGAVEGAKLKRLTAVADQLSVNPPEFYRLRESKRMIRQEPWTYVSLVEASNNRSFAGWKVFDRAAGMFEGLGLQGLFDRDVAEFVELMLRDIYLDDKMMAPEDGRSFVVRGAEAARVHGVETLLSYFRSLGATVGLSALEDGIPVEYAKVLA